MDTSVAVKWFKPGERYEAEALDLIDRIDRSEVEAVASEIVTLEVVRALKNAQVQQPALGITDARIRLASGRLEGMFASGALLQSFVREVKPQAIEIELALGLFMADAVHLATAVYVPVQYLVVDDRHFLTPDVITYAAGFGVQVVNLPDLIAALNAAGRGVPPSP
ncbi:MAG TPA: type II toxin-antitoxin system VapC family toxin [Gemmataceae bacterium]|nr:type II toxin-antitoxin system VapC family toxin [Gemmataceae bacterium]